MTVKFLAVATMVAASIVPAAACRELLPTAEEAGHEARAVTAHDLATLRDIGQANDRLHLESPLGVSPSGRQVAFVLRRADPDTNDYCQGLVVLDLDRPADVRLLDTGGALIRERHSLYGHAFPQNGVPKVILPRWSPDGTRIAYLKRTGAAAQIWLAATGGAGAAVLTDAPAGVEDFAWSSDGRALIFESRVGEREAQATIDREARTGFLVDDRFRPITARRPFAREKDIAIGRFRIDAATRETRPATAAEAAQLGSGRADRAAGILDRATGPAGVVAWVSQGGNGLEDRRLTARLGGAEQICSRCTGEIVDLWWSRGGDLFFLSREGRAREALSLSRWRPGSRRPPRRLLVTEDLLIGCRSVRRDDILCLSEAAQNPRRLVIIDGATGAVSPLWSPNPGFDRLEHAQVRRLFWSNENGFATFGDLVLPSPRAAKPPYPLVIVQYGSRGFLRGGTGDEYPIRALAARGIAVLSFQRPLHVPLQPGPAAAGAAPSEHVERKSVQSALERGIATALATGMIDGGRIGITGLSDGATTAQWALVAGTRFAAAAISTCCFDPGLVTLFSAPQIDAYAADAIPRPGEDDSRFWAPLSLAANAARIETPILMQLADDEFLGGLSTFRSLQTAHRPVEMYVFPGEHHIKFQPAHRLAIYERNLQWFDFWLRGREEATPGLAAQYARWRAMRDRLSHASRTSGPPLQPRTHASASTSARMR